MKKIAALLILALVSSPAFATEDNFTLEEFFHIVDTTGVSAVSCYENLVTIDKMFSDGSVVSQEEKTQLVEKIDIFCSRAVYGQDVIEDNPKLVKQLTALKPETTELLDGVKAVNETVHKFISVVGLRNFPILRYTFTELGKKRMKV